MEIEIAQIERRSQHKQLIAKIRQEDRDLIDTSRLWKNLERMSKQRKNAIIKSFRNNRKAMNTASIANVVIRDVEADNSVDRKRKKTCTEHSLNR